MMNSNHPYHMVTPSLWPLMTSINLMNLLMSTLNWFYLNMMNLFLINLMIMTTTIYQWWRDVIRESTMQGCHTLSVMNLMKMSMIMFIISELFFLISFFWTFFHNSMSPAIEIGSNWPPQMILPINPYDNPLLNTTILISSGLSITWSYHSTLNNKKNFTKLNLLITIILGIYFSMLQLMEYMETTFCFNDSIYGSIFFMTTGFHGLNVMIGITFLSTCLIRLLMNHFSTIHHFHFEAASWYWHFVDIIWLFLYTSIY